METQQIFNKSESKLNASFFFLSLGVLVTLITSVVSFLNLVFATLDKRFPDVLNSNYYFGYSTYNYESMRMALATLIIFFPVFLVVSYFWKKFTLGSMGRFDEVIKKWLVYLILFISSLVVVVDLVTLVRYFVSGEITSRFAMKVLVVLVTMLLVGYYYFSIARSKDSSKISKAIAVIGVILVLGAIICSFMIMGSPQKQRLLRLDDRRVGDLQNIQYQVINFWQQKEKLPATLEELKNPITGYSLPVPPEYEKGEKYEYRPIDAMKFEVCATFALPMPKGWVENGGGVRPMYFKDYVQEVGVSMPYPGGVNESWDHDAGRACFERVIDRDIYPPFEKR